MARLYDLRRWRNGRARHLKEHPLCVNCQSIGKVTPGQVVDHNPPHNNNHDAFFDERTWVSLCKRCHDAVTARADGGFGNVKRSDRTAPVMGCNTSGIPQDKAHHWRK